MTMTLDRRDGVVAEPVFGRRDPDARGYFGAYGGRFVPETLVEPVAALERAYFAARADRAFVDEFVSVLRQFVGRPTPLYEAARLSEDVGCRVFLKREDLAHTGAHKINNAIGQALLAKRMGKTRVVAETGAGQHGVASATACALLGLECVVYMGTEDMARQALNVVRMRLLGATVVGVDAGSRTLKDAISEAMRDWVGRPHDTTYLLGSALGPHPYPLMVREFQSIIGQEARQQILAQAGRLPDAVLACIGGGSNAIGLFDAFIDDAGVRLIGVEAGGEGITPGRHAARFSGGSPGRAAGHVDLRAAGRRRQHRADALGVGRPRLRGHRSRARDAARPGPGQLPLRHRRRGAAGLRLAGAQRGPAAGARIGARDRRGARRRRRDRPRRDPRRQPVGPRRQGRAPGRRPGRAGDGGALVSQRLADTFTRLRGSGGPGLVTYVTAGDPGYARSREILLALDRAGADVIELGVPFSEPLADGPVIQRATERALAGGMTLAKTLDLVEELRGQVRAPIVLFTYANPIYRLGIDAFAARARQAGVDGVLALDLPIEEAGPLQARLAADAIDTIFLVSPTTTDERLRRAGELGSGFLYGISRLGVTGIRADVAAGAEALAARMRKESRLPVALGFGLSRPEHIRDVGRWADAAVVGSALVDVIARAGDSPAVAGEVERFVRWLKAPPGTDGETTPNAEERAHG